MKNTLLYRTIEWHPRLINLSKRLEISHYVLPDLPKVYSESDRKQFFDMDSSKGKIMTIAACHHTENTLRKLVMEMDENVDKALVVGGNEKKEKFNGTSQSAKLSSSDAIEVLLDQDSKLEVWATSNPNSEKSVDDVNQKISSGASGIITQPLLSSSALDIFNAYPRQKSMSQGDDEICLRTQYVAGVAMPSNNKSLQFWLTLLRQPELENDSLFKSHMAFFQSPYFSSLSWIQRELWNLETNASIDGFHFMPMQNICDLEALLCVNKPRENIYKL